MAENKIFNSQNLQLSCGPFPVIYLRLNWCQNLIGNLRTLFISHSWIWRLHLTRSIALHCDWHWKVLEFRLSCWNWSRSLTLGHPPGVRIGQKLSARFATFSSVRQGCVLASALFCAAIDYIMEHVSCSCGITVGGSRFTDLDYADDVALLVNEPVQFAQVLRNMLEELSKFMVKD